MMMMMMMMSHHIQNRKRLCITSFKVVFLKKERKGKERAAKKSSFTSFVARTSVVVGSGF